MIQLQVLSKIITDNDPSLIINNNLNEEYFSEYKDVFKFLMEHIASYDCLPDAYTVVDKFPNLEIIDVKEPDSYLMKELKKDYDQRYLVTCFNKMREPIINKDIDKAMEIFMKTVDGFTENVSFNPVDLIRDTSRLDDFMRKKESSNKWFISTGFSEIDNKLGGGWDKEEELATIVARTNIGKSWILIKCAQAAAKQGLNVGIYSGEMSANKVGYRFDTFASNAEYGKDNALRNGDLVHANPNLDTSRYKKYLEELKYKYTGSLKVLTPSMINGPAGVNALRSFIKKEKLDILFIDQHSLLEDDKHARTPVERASNISRDLKNLQVMCKIPIISVSQQNRTKSDTGEVDTTQIAQSDRIGQDSTVILFLERSPEPDVTDEREKQKKNILTISLVKSRDSENGVFWKYRIDFNTGNFECLTKDPEGEGIPVVEDKVNVKNIETSVSPDVYNDNKSGKIPYRENGNADWGNDSEV